MKERFFSAVTSVVSHQQLLQNTQTDHTPVRQRMRSWALWWLLIFSSMLHHTHHSSPGCCHELDYLTCASPSEKIKKKDASHAECCINTAKNIWNNVHNPDHTVKALKTLTDILEKTEVTGTNTFYKDNILALLYKPKENFQGLEISASDNEVRLDSYVPNSKMSVRLPSEINAGPNNTVVFCMIQLPNTTVLPRLHELDGRRLIALSVGDKDISGLKERVTITIKVTTSIQETLTPQCVFLNSAEKSFSTYGCETEYNQSHVTCSCDHLTYFGVLMVSAQLSPKDQLILSYITYIGCSISLIALAVAILLFITNRKLRGDDSKKIHISLAVSLILLNVHFLPSQAAAASSSSGLCLYVALLLHYSLLASFTWMALEGFHLYLLLIKVFNVFVRRYLLKLSVVGWGLPSVIVSLVVIIDRDIYGRTPLDSSRPNETAVCYITNDKVKMGTTVGLFSVMFVFNGVVFLGIAKWLTSDTFRKQNQMGAMKNKTKRDIFTLLSLMVLLGLTWGLIFFSFGQLTTAGLYAFCIINPLQGFFILVYFVLAVKKSKTIIFKPSTQTNTTKS